MAKQKESKKQNDKTTAAHTPKEKKAIKAQKKLDKNSDGKLVL